MRVQSACKCSRVNLFELQTSEFPCTHYLRAHKVSKLQIYVSFPFIFHFPIETLVIKKLFFVLEISRVSQFHFFLHCGVEQWKIDDNISRKLCFCCLHVWIAETSVLKNPSNFLLTLLLLAFSWWMFFGIKCLLIRRWYARIFMQAYFKIHPQRIYYECSELRANPQE